MTPTKYFDLQVNGYAGVDFNCDDLSPESLHLACESLQRDGVSGILATIITERLDLMCARLARLAKLRERDPLVAEVMVGLHVEGPFLNETPGYRGAHPADAIVAADTDAMKRLLDAGRGLVRLVTLAPERDSQFAVTKALAERGVIVAGGHSDANLDELRGACDAGLSLWTHLGNGCPMAMHRHDNIVQRVLSLCDQLIPCFIADGVHVPFFALGNYLRTIGTERSIVVTDAIAPAGLGPGLYTLGRWELKIGADMVARAPDGSHLVGSAITMPQSGDNLKQQLGLSPADVERLTSINPRVALGLACD